MRISFRQGLVRVQPGFLQLQSGKVNLQVPPVERLLVAFADGTSDYLLTERTDITAAWPGPFVAGPQSYWLYWDINTVTGARTFGHTLYEPVDSGVAPNNPVNDQHWFDTSIKKMKVWNSTTHKWVNKIRVFAAKLSSGSVFVSMSINSPVFTGTQVGLVGEAQAGALVFDADGAPLKRSNSTFFTTEDVAVTGVASSSQVKLGSIVLEAESQASIPAFTLVRFTDFNKITVANTNVVNAGAYGIIEVDASPGEVVAVIMEGVITNPTWDWSSIGINAVLYSDMSGNLVHTAPIGTIPAATVIDRHSILMRPSPIIFSNDSLPPISGSPNQLVGINNAGDSTEYKTLHGTVGEIEVVHAPNSITLSLDDLDLGSF